ncbi:DUF1360 domain-containing protein [Aneurinibacillus migulanus]|uniref:Sporulation protein n=1 Tax=Aneurinibacillus migulanus TaxID=47500 RepID=A0A0D1VVC7_ANEMI|nr:DUF1360 domain-containing protein [Aneurinibacillus migulanus]KIV50195.1 sporulation protein [Aneurinibacillus migulanus]KON96230.1 sporulation protein [Aneurinibacillus migulanus]MED0895485.1 DUF1360 domain-containing protein [Aneurinibacillus migulanus]MED1618353.1 DUF1360 domain-containing protein [Aneurinibacillus migulanus]SDI76337.1 Protein of unknown function [Aneurinibacillus migulanus]
MPELSWLHLVVLVLASFRLTHFIVFDEIASFIRTPFLTTTHEEDANGQMIQQIEVKGTGLRRWIGKLLSCYWCVGIWSSILVVALYWFFPGSFIFLLILAVAGAAAVIETKI